MAHVEHRKYGNVFWVVALISAGLLGWSIGGSLVWWAFLIPWLVYYGLLLSFLVGVFVIAFLGVLLSAFIEWQEEKERNRRYDRKC